MKSVPINLLRESLSKLLVSYGMKEKDAQDIAKYFVEIDSYGVHTHGCSTFKAHLERLIRGGYNTDVLPDITKSTSSFAVVDAHGTFGMLSAKFCMELSIEECGKSGIFCVFSHNCNTYGAAFYYTKFATDKGLIGITFCNTPKQMAAYNGKQKILGTNPVAIGIPGNKKGPILFDMSSSVVAKSKINDAKKRGESIPYGWALDESGRPTTNPDEAVKGSVLPVGGAKGYGIALTIDVLAGMLSGADYLDGVNKFYSNDNSCMDVGQVFVALDPKIIASDKFYDDIDEYIDKLHNSGASSGMVRFPGERKLQEHKKSVLSGEVELSESVIEEINELLKGNDIAGSI